MKKLIALAVIAAGALAADSAEIAVGQSFNADDDVADKLIQSGQAKEDVPPPPKVKTAKARVLVAGAFGEVNTVVEVEAKLAKSHPDLDADPAAVAYAESLVQPT